MKRGTQVYEWIPGWLPCILLAIFDAPIEKVWDNYVQSKYNVNWILQQMNGIALKLHVTFNQAVAFHFGWLTKMENMNSNLREYMDIRSVELISYVLEDNRKVQIKFVNTSEG